MHQLTGKKNKITIYLLFFIVLCSINSKSNKNLNFFSNKINTIYVFGLSKENNLEIKEKLNQLYLGSIFFIKKKNMDNIILEYNLVENYKVKKIYPKNIRVDIEPTKFIAKIKKDKIFIVGANGKLIDSKTTYKKLPFLMGEYKQDEFLKFKKIIDESRFKFNEFESLYFHPSERWDIITRGKILIKLPENNLLKALKIAHKIINNDQFISNKIIDLRISNQIILQK